MTGLLVACVVLLTVAIVTMAAALWFISNRMGSLAREAECALRAAREHLDAVSGDLRSALAKTEGLLGDLRVQISRIDRMFGGIERIADGKAVADATGKAVRSSRTKILAAVEGIKQGLKTLRGTDNKPKEDADNE